MSIKWNLTCSLKEIFQEGESSGEKKHTYPGGNVESHAGEGVNKLLHQTQWIVRIDENYGYTD